MERKVQQTSVFRKNRKHEWAFHLFLTSLRMYRIHWQKMETLRYVFKYNLGEGGGTNTTQT